MSIMSFGSRIGSSMSVSRVAAISIEAPTYRHIQSRLRHTHSPFSISYGQGGRSSNSGITATVFGAYGFVGRYLVNELGQRGSRVYVPYRGCELEIRHLKPMFDLGQLGLIAFSPRDEDSIVESLSRSDVVVNMIGKHYETKHLIPTRRSDGVLSRVNYSFEEMHIDIPRRLARLAKKAGVNTFIHVSALAADVESSSRWSQTKALGEQAVREEFPEAIIVKPANVFGSEDRFLNWIAEASDRLPVFPLINNGNTLVQPVYANDVGKALMTIINNHNDFKGKTFQLTGPAEYTYKEVIEFVSDVTTLKKPMVDVPINFAQAVGGFLSNTISPILTPDIIAQLQEDNVEVSNSSFLTLDDLNIEKSSMEKESFNYLHRFRPGGHFTLASGYSRSSAN